MNDILGTIRAWLDGQDGFLLAGLLCAAFVVLCVVCAIVNALAKIDRTGEPLGVRHDRLDAEAHRATTQPSSSQRKSGRVSVGGAR